MAKKAKVKNWIEFFKSNPKDIPFSDVDVIDDEGRTMLMGAASTSDADIIRRIIDAGADVNSICDDGDTAFNLQLVLIKILPLLNCC